MDHIGMDPLYHIAILLAIVTFLGGFVAFKLRAQKSQSKNANLPASGAAAPPVKNLVPQQTAVLNKPTNAKTATKGDKPNGQGIPQIVDKSGSGSNTLNSTSTPKSTVVDQPTVQRKPDARLTLSVRFRTSRVVKAENHKITLEVNQTSNPIPLEAEGWLSIESPVSVSFGIADGLAKRSVHPKSTSVALPKGSVPTQVRIKRTINGGIDLLAITTDPQPIGSQA